MATPLCQFSLLRACSVSVKSSSNEKAIAGTSFRTPALMSGANAMSASVAAGPGKPTWSAHTSGLLSITSMSP